MKKKRELLLSSIIFCMLLIMGVNTLTASASSTRTKAMQAYRRYLIKNRYEKIYPGSIYNKMEYFTVIDINQDKIPELITMSDGNRKIGVFTYYKGKVKCVSDFAGIIWAEDKKGDYIEYNSLQKALVIRTHGGTGLSGYELVSLKNRKLVEKFSVSMSSQWGRNGYLIKRSCGYTKAGSSYKACSYSTYNKYCRKYFIGKKVKKYYFVKNNAQNRKVKLA